MKKILKTSEPASLVSFRQTNPGATWKQLRNEASTAYQDCRQQTVRDQKGLCAYCEAELELDRVNQCRVEHFHQKSASRSGINWHLDWANMLAVCGGGEQPEPEIDPVYNQKPDNLSCDTYKNHLVNKGELSPESFDILNPQAIPAFPNIFRLLKVTGYLEPDETACAQASIDLELVKKNIQTFNLNCNRLARKRYLRMKEVENSKEQLRRRHYGSHEGLKKLAERYFGGPNWPQFFTTLRYCLGAAAEEYLRSQNYQG